MMSRPFINRHSPPQKHQARQPLAHPLPRLSRPYVICSPEGCAIIKNPKHAPKQPTTYLTPDYDYDSDDYDYYDRDRDGDHDHLESSHAM